MKAKMIFLAACLFPCMAQAQVSISRTVPYQDAGVGTEAIRKECDWNTQLSGFILKYAKGAATITDQPLQQVGGQSLSMVVSSLHAVSGGSFTGPKWASVRGELRDGDHVVGSFTFRRTTSHGKFSTCGTLTYIAKALGESIGDWLQHPGMDTNQSD